MTKTPPNPGLCLVTEARDCAERLARIGAALDATGAVTLVLTASGEGPIDPAAARPLVELAHKKKIAALLVNDVPAARATDADGVHLTSRDDMEDAYRAARAALGPDAIVGADAGSSRHDAMMLGESGADYVAFGRTPVTGDGTGAGNEETEDAAESQRDLVAWWADIFLVPVVAFDVETAEEAAGLARLGADFVAVLFPGDMQDEAVKTWAADLVAGLQAPADAA